MPRRLSPGRRCAIAHRWPATGRRAHARGRAGPDAGLTGVAGRACARASLEASCAGRRQFAGARDAGGSLGGRAAPSLAHRTCRTGHCRAFPVSVHTHGQAMAQAFPVRVRPEGPRGSSYRFAGRWVVSPPAHLCDQAVAPGHGARAGGALDGDRARENEALLAPDSGRGGCRIAELGIATHLALKGGVNIFVPSCGGWDSILHIRAEPDRVGSPTRGQAASAVGGVHRAGQAAVRTCVCTSRRHPGGLVAAGISQTDATEHGANANEDFRMDRRERWTTVLIRAAWMSGVARPRANANPTADLPRPPVGQVPGRWCPVTGPSSIESPAPRS